jgi:hypothetical protein
MWEGFVTPVLFFLWEGFVTPVLFFLWEGFVTPNYPIEKAVLKDESRNRF